MNTARVSAYAKLNLTLDITGAKDGYHLLDSLVVSVDLFDRIVAKKRKGALSSVAMHGMGSERIPPEENNALRAAEAFSATFGTDGAAISVYKNIPMGSGMGGSSADAAGVLLALARLYKITDRAALTALGERLGSDVAFQLRGGFARMRGRGESLEFFGSVPKWWFLVLTSKEEISTAACYARYDEAGNTFPPRTERALEALRGGNPEWAAKLFGNHLTEAATDLLPEMEETLKTLRGFSPAGWGMTGSGSAAYAAFGEEQLALWAKSRYRGKRHAFIVRTVDPTIKKSWRNPYVLGEDEGE